MGTDDRSAREQAVLADVSAAVAPLHLVVEGVQVTPAGKRRLVRVLVDKDLSDLPSEDTTSSVAPLTLDEIADATRAVSEALDASDVMGSQPYVLEVSSPGTDRPLTEPRHFRRNVGRLVEVAPRDGASVTGRITAADADGVELTDDRGKHRLTYADIGPGKVQLEFNRADEEI